MGKPWQPASTNVLIAQLLMILCMRLEKKFTLLRDIAGGLVTVLPSTPTVESDFSQIKWKMNEFRSART
jgi:hypothetical protein